MDSLQGEQGGRKVDEEEEDEKKKEEARLQLTDSADIGTISGPGSISRRMRTLLLSSSQPSVHEIGWRVVHDNPFDPATNPTGCIELGLAENILSLDLLEEWWNKNAKPLDGDRGDGLLQIAHYPESYRGSLKLRTAVASFMTTVMTRGQIDVDPSHLIMCNGASTAIELLALALADHGEAFLVPSPYYLGLARDVEPRAGVRLVPVPSSSEYGFSITRDALEEAYNKATAQGIQVRGLITTTPCNPTGTTYGRDVLAMFVDFVREKQIHLIADEIYAGSVFRPPAFVSVLEVVSEEAEAVQQCVHVVYGFAKDLGLAAFRVGVVHTRNELVMQGLRPLLRFSVPSSPVDRMLTPLLLDKPFMEKFLVENARRLQERWTTVVSSLERSGLGYLAGNAGIFVWVDLSKLMSEQTPEEEMSLWRRLLFDVGIHLNPGSKWSCQEPGWFRFCFGAVDDVALSVALRRLHAFSIER